MKAFFKNIIVGILTLEARAILKKYKPIVIGVTGSVGKTSTKDAIAAVVGTSYTVRKSQKSFNSEFGIPLTIIGKDTAWGSVFGWLSVIMTGVVEILFSREYPDVLVLEIGVDHPGDMARAMRWLTLDIAVVTYIGDKPVHVEAFLTVEQLVREKLLILSGIKQDGAAIFIQDDPRVLVYKGIFKGRSMTFGFNEGATVRGDKYLINYDAYGTPEGIEANILVGSSAFPITQKGVVGRQFIYPVLAACAVAKACAIDLEVAINALEKHEPGAGRMRLLKGVRDSILIDDTYNSSPVAAREALEALRDVRARGKKRAVLGDMRELGRLSKEAHKEIGELAASVLDTLITVGSEAREIAQAAKNAGLKDVVSFDTSPEAAPYVREHVESGDAILTKGSQGVRIEHVTKALLKDQKDIKLLVRQGREWERR